MIISEVIFFTSLIYPNCSEYIISELRFCLKRIEFEHVSYSQDTSTELKKNNSLKRILTKSLSVDRLYGMQMSVLQFMMLHRHHYHKNCDYNFCKVSDIHEHSSTTIGCKKSWDFQIDKKMTITSFFSQLKLNTVLPEVQNFFYFHHTSFSVHCSSQHMLNLS